jgi:hypothetical protein
MSVVAAGGTTATWLAYTREERPGKRRGRGDIRVIEDVGACPTQGRGLGKLIHKWQPLATPGDDAYWGYFT